MTKNYDESVKLITEMKQMLNQHKTKKLTLEGLVYGEDGEEMMGEPTAPTPEGGNQIGNTPAPEAAPQQQPHHNQLPGIDQKEANPLDGDPEIAKLITNIRVQTLEGLRKLAENPESAQYELLKKIFLLVDKAVEDKIDPEK